MPTKSHRRREMVTFYDYLKCDTLNVKCEPMAYFHYGYTAWKFIHKKINFFGNATLLVAFLVAYVINQPNINLITKCKVCKSVLHHKVPINEPTRCNNFPSLLLDDYVRLNMFRVSTRPSSGAQLPYHDQQHCYHRAQTVTKEAATAVVELLIMGVRTPNTCWVVNKRQVINLGNCCNWLVDLLQ